MIAAWRARRQAGQCRQNDSVRGKVLCDGSGDGFLRNLGGRSDFQGSPTAADCKIYVLNFDAEVSVLQAGGAEFKLLHQMSFKDPGDATRHRSSVAISQGNLFVRTGTKVFCLGH